MMRAVWIFLLLSWALVATGAWAFEREEARALQQQRDRALAACDGSE